MRDFLTADLHMGHEAVAKLRGFTTAEEHDQTVWDHIRNTVPHDSRLWVLGDLVSGFDTPVVEIDTVSRFAERLDECGIELHVITGNHDCVHPSRSKAARHLRGYGRVVESVASIGTMKIAGHRCILSHYPYEGDHKAQDRDIQWRPRDMGEPIIHGHTHATAPVSWSSTGTLQICVSLDAWDLHPVPKDALAYIIGRHRTAREETEE